MFGEAFSCAILSGSEVLRSLLWLGTLFFDEFLGIVVLAKLLGGGGGGGIEMVPCFLFETLLPSTAVVCGGAAGGCKL